MNGSPFTLVVTIGIDALMSGLGVAALDTGHRISAGEARRLACRAGIIPMVLDGDSMPLDLGRREAALRPLPEASPSTSATTAAPPTTATGHRPGSSTTTRTPGAAGGTTDASNGISLCPAHHRMADHPDSYDMRRLPDGKVRFNRRT